MNTITDKATSKTTSIAEVKAIIREALFATYGVSEIANIKTTKGKEEGIIIRKRSDNTFCVDIYLIVSQDVKITETLRSAQKSVRYTLNKKFPKQYSEVNVYANDISSK